MKTLCGPIGRLARGSASRAPALLAVLLAFGAAAGPARADITGSIEGRVFDDSGQALAGAWVQLAGDMIRSPVLEARTRRDGSFRIAALPPGVYAVTASREGFQVLTLTEVAVEPGRITRVELALLPGVLTDELLLERPAEPALGRDSLGLAEPIMLAHRLPLERGLAELLAPLPGLALFPGQAPAFRGAPPRASATLIEGFSLLAPLDRERRMSFILGAPASHLVASRGAQSVEYGDFVSGLVDLAARSGRGVDRAFGDLGWRGAAGGARSDSGADWPRWNEFEGLLGGELGRYGYMVTGGVLDDQGEPGSAAVSGHYRGLQSTWVGADYLMTARDEASLVIGLEDDWRDPEDGYRARGYNSILDHRRSELVTVITRHRLGAAGLLSAGYSYLLYDDESGARAGERGIRAPADYVLEDPEGQALPDWPYVSERREALHRLHARLVTAPAADYELRAGFEAEIDGLTLLEGRIGDPATFPESGLAGPNPAVEVDETTYRLAAYTHTRWDSSPRVALLPGLRVEYDAALSGPFLLVPRAALAFAVSPDWTLGAAVGRYTARPPLRAVFERAANEDGREAFGDRGRELGGERAVQADGSSRWRLRPGLELGAAGFYRVGRDRVAVAPAEEGRQAGEFVTLAKEKVAGGELDLTADLAPGLTARLAYSYVRARGPVAGEDLRAVAPAPGMSPPPPAALGGGRPLAWEAPHRATVELAYRTERLGGIEVVVRSATQSGKPYTQAYEEGGELFWGPVNGARTETATRLDAWLVKRIPLARGVAVNLDLKGMNLLDSDAAGEVDPVTGRPDGVTAAASTWGGRSASAGVRITF